MGALKDLINKVADGSVTMDEALPEFKKVLVTREEGRPDGSLTYEQIEERAEAGLPDSTDTFSQVTAAWIQGKIDDEQYTAFREAATADMRLVSPANAEQKSDEDAPEGEATEPETPVEDPNA
jgi:hypothetical protein